ncbi:hypothetical protein INT48_009514 [Thamnidium elegans]|uniref:RxLR effector protein n=1 Tax=Thamnidium elegans TaxID=101142 RepID=A0A8H7SYI2_9FUNG|nr:hypothetical protein INT48_009514 [Thamnidium elegans]
MFIRFATLSLIVAVALSSVSAARSNVASVDVASNPSGAKLALPVMRTSLNRRKVASLLERRISACDHHNHKNYHHGDDIKYHRRPRYHHFCPEEAGPYCGEPDEYEEYDHYDYDDDEYYECDECDECEDDDFGYLSWEDYEDETT